MSKRKKKHKNWRVGTAREHGSSLFSYIRQYAPHATHIAHDPKSNVNVPYDMLAHADLIFQPPAPFRHVNEAIEFVRDIWVPAQKANGVEEKRQAIFLNNARKAKKARPLKIKLKVQEKSRAREVRLAAFYDSWEWKQCRYNFIKEKKRRCQCCGATPDDGVRIVVDHIRPIRHYWDMRLNPNNLQILCSSCNMGKGSMDETDWRDKPQMQAIMEQLKPRE